MNAAQRHASAKPLRALLLAVAALLTSLGLAGRLVAQQRLDSIHGALPAGLDCSACHTVEGWKPPRSPMAFTHGAVSGFRLAGAHAKVTCRGCHLDLRFDGPKVPAGECASCHQDLHEGRMFQDCTSCHTTESFSTVDGNRVHMLTSFPLTGSHLRLDCESCHVDDRGGSFSSLPTDCAACHLPDYRSARTVDHGAAGYPTSCSSCHGTVTWRDALFDHAVASSGFSLIGAHGGLTCESCHTVPGMATRFPATSPEDCVACHLVDYQKEHAGSGFPTTCRTCHTPSSWDGAQVDHVALSRGFQLLGAHASASCSECHAGPSYTLLFPKPGGQQDCVACHQREYDTRHVGTGFPTACLNCHTVNSWSGATVDHPALSGGFQLLGAHATATCAACHAVPGYALLFPRPAGQLDCVACHRIDFDRAHAGRGYPTTCSTCHTVSSWASTFNHDTQFFRINSGPHRGKWPTCASCHTTPSSFTTFTCLTCHEHSKTEMDQKHRERQAYQYVSTACYACHRNEL